MPQVPALLPLSQTLPPAPLLHLSRGLFSSSFPASFGRGLALAYRGQPGRRHTHPRRGSSTLRKGPKEEMANGGDKEVVFNRKRVEGEGKDGGKCGSMELKTRRLNPVNTTCYVQILGTGMDTQGTSPSILLFFDKQRFIFNVGEDVVRDSII